MSEDSVIIVGKKGIVVSRDVITKAITRFPAAGGFAAANSELETIVQGKCNFDVDTPLETHIEAFMKYQTDLKDFYKVFWFSKTPTTEESLQPFSVVSVTEGEGEDAEETDKIVAFLSGDFTAKVKEEGEHTGAFWSYVEDVRPPIMQYLQRCVVDDEVDLDKVKTSWPKEAPELAKKMLGEHCAIIMLTPNGDCHIYEEDGGPGHSEQDYWVSSLLDDPPAKPVEKPAAGLMVGSKKKVKSTTSVPAIAAATTPPEEAAQGLKMAKGNPPSWARSSNSITTQWYEAANPLRDGKGKGVVPPNATSKYPPIDVDARVLEFKGTKMKDFQNFCDNLRNHVTEKPGEVPYVRSFSADDLARIERDFIPLVKKGMSPTEIQAEEKPTATFKEITLFSWDDMRRVPEQVLVAGLTGNAKLAARMIFDLLHRPVGVVTGKVGDEQPDAHPVPPPVVVKKKVGGVRLG